MFLLLPVTTSLFTWTPDSSNPSFWKSKPIFCIQYVQCGGSYTQDKAELVGEGEDLCFLKEIGKVF